MAETSFLCFFTYSIPGHNHNHNNNHNHSRYPLISSPSSLHYFPSRSPSSPFRLATKAKPGGSLFGNANDEDDDNNDDDLSLFGAYPWQHLNPNPNPNPNHSGIQWGPEDKITFFTSDGLIQLGGSMSPKRITPSEKQRGQAKAYQRYQRFQESDYMDPKQSLCLGALFQIAATNGLDMGRRLCIIGFCRSIEMLSDVVEDTVLEHGGEVVVAEKASESGLQGKLRMTVAVPYLWGVPPASETLHLAVRSGGGIVQKTFWQWHFL